MYNLIVTAGSSYIDVDAYACIVAMSELLQLRGESAVAWSCAPCNYSVCPSFLKARQVQKKMPADNEGESQYIIVDVSDPDFLEKSVPLERVVAVYDHHVGFEEYWTKRIGENARIEFIGAAASLIYREWVKAGLQDKMSRATALLLIAAILDNTLNLTSSNTTDEDVAAFQALCSYANVDENWCTGYFSEVQAGVEADLRNALFNDIKSVRDNRILPPSVAQLCVWDAERILHRLPEIRQWFDNCQGGWMINVIDIQHRCSWFVCEDPHYQKEIQALFDVVFEDGVARTAVPYLRKELIKKTMYR